MFCVRGCASLCKLKGERGRGTMNLGGCDLHAQEWCSRRGLPFKAVAVGASVLKICSLSQMPNVLVAQHTPG